MNRTTYLMAVGSAQAAAPYILATGRPVLAIGGFLDRYQEASVDQLSKLVSSGKLRFIMADALDRHPSIAAWIKRECEPVSSSACSGGGFQPPGGGMGVGMNSTLDDCAQYHRAAAP